ncbi:hypothetical protein [Fodinicola acaciae]|uniref:hypothetical protein n=1 Tax=Fodinicola acaciae TaxID=2681555 RepID=UPI0013D4D67F|nr:hypothetical protein [Fodinicola acaciae]
MSYPHQSGFDPQPPPKKSRTGLIVTLSVVGAVVLLLCCGGVAGIFLFNPLKPASQPRPQTQTPAAQPSSSASTRSQPDNNTGGASTARDAADRYLTAVKSRDDKAAAPVTCASLGQQPPPGMPAGLDPSTIQVKSFTYTISKDDATSDTHHDVTAPTQITLTVAGEDYDATGTYKLGVDKQGGGWKVCQASFSLDG